MIDGSAGFCQSAEGVWLPCQRSKETGCEHQADAANRAFDWKLWTRTQVTFLRSE